jgi:tyrosine-protein kinase Etk/Wzc
MIESSTKGGQSAIGQDREIRLIDIAIVMAKSRKAVIGFPLAVAILSALASLAIPNTYKATAKLLPPQQAQSGAAALLSQLGGISGMAGGVAGLKNPNDLYVGMLNSRTVADRLVERFRLRDVYDIESTEKARGELKENSMISAGRDGLITIEVEDKSPQLVAQIANGYVDELLKLTKVLAVTEASQRRIFFERQLELTKDNLAAAETKLKGALDTHGVVSVDGQSRAIVETVGRLRAQASAKEIQLSSMQAFVTPSNPAYKQVQEELSSLRAELSRLENGRADSIAATPSAGKTQGLENIKILRDVKYYQMLYELLAKQYEVARLDEAKDVSIIQVLDAAVVPERKSKPARFLIVLSSTLLALAGAIAYAFIKDTRERAMQNPAGAARWDEFKSNLRVR